MSYRIIVSPAKKMNVVDDEPHPRTQPVFLAQTIRLMHEVQRLSYEECRELWKCSDKLARPNYQRFQAMDLTQASSAAVRPFGSPAMSCFAPAGSRSTSLPPRRGSMMITGMPLAAAASRPARPAWLTSSM